MNCISNRRIGSMGFMSSLKLVIDKITALSIKK